MPVHTDAVMGTFVSVDVGGDGAGAAAGRALAWFRDIESACTRFDPRSELMRLTARAGTPVAASPALFEAVRFAVALAEETGGAFDPTVGHRMANRGFDREHRSGDAAPRADGVDDDVSFRDVLVDEAERTITLRRPLVLDLGAVAKGLAIDAAARELRAFGDFAIDAGGDLYLGGRNRRGEPWAVGIRHPADAGELLQTVRVSDRAVCTSGGYERPASASAGGPGEHHIIDPRSGRSPADVASVTVVAPSAMLADALATAAFVLGPVDGLALLGRLDVEGLIVTHDLARHSTPGFPR